MMKNFYMMALAALVGSAAMAQVSVTFRVDMSDQTVSPDGVHVAGDWQDGLPGEDIDAGDWNPATHQMMDDVGFGIYELTVEVAPGSYQFKYVNGNAWGSDENAIPEVSQKGGGNSNRFFVVTDWHAANGGHTLPAVKFNGSSPEGQVAVRMTIDMMLAGDIVDAGVHVAGDFSDPVWTPALSSAVNVTGSQYAFVANVAPNNTYEYKWLNGNDFITDVSENATGDCAVDGGNRFVDVAEEDVELPVYCFQLCETCTDPVLVQFTVDLNGAPGGPNAEGAFIAGTFNGYQGEPMDDLGDGIYSISMELFPGEIEWKFQNGPGGWEPDFSSADLCGNPSGGNNRFFVVEESAELVEVGPFCFGTCNADCDVLPTANITFQVDMSEETVAAEGVFFIGNFTTPVWQPGAELMTDNGDGIWSITLPVSGPTTFQYKYVNGDVNVPANEEFNGFAEGLPCIISNNFDGWNRVHTRTGEDETIIVVPFNSCGALNATTADLGMVNIYPNPSNGSTFIEVENPNGYNLHMSVLDITGKVVRDNILLNSGRKEINTSNFAPGMYFLNVTNEKSERSVYKLMVR